MLEEARDLDAADPLASFRDRFVIDDPDLIYLDGNSLGRMPKAAVDVMDRLKGEWGGRLVRGWGEGWYDLPQRLGAKIARLIGAGDDEVIVCDSTSVNLFKLARAAVGNLPVGARIITDESNFPSDLYVLQGTRIPAIALRSGKRGFVEPAQFSELMDASLGRQLLVLSHVDFRSGYVHPLETLTREAHKRFGRAIWDLSHSVGAMPLEMKRNEVDMAVGCTYKYLNGGPGSPAFLYVRKDFQEKLQSPIRGWFGQRDPFQFKAEYDPAPGIDRFLAGTPPILSMATAEPGIDLVLEAGVDEIRRKSVKQTDYLVRLFDEYLEPAGFKLRSPRDSAIRGSHVSISHPKALQIDQALIQDMNVVPDFRQPDNLRLGVGPLYTRFQDLYEGVMRIRQVMDQRLHERYPDEGPAVT